jgi:hypothetical protein
MISRVENNLLGLADGNPFPGPHAETPVASDVFSSRLDAYDVVAIVGIVVSLGVILVRFVA